MYAKLKDQMKNRRSVPFICDLIKSQLLNFYATVCCYDSCHVYFCEDFSYNTAHDRVCTGHAEPASHGIL